MEQQQYELLRQLVIADVRQSYPDMSEAEAIEHAINVWTPTDPLGDAVSEHLTYAYRTVVKREGPKPITEVATRYEVLYAVVTDGMGSLYLVDDSLRPDPSGQPGYRFPAPAEDAPTSVIKALYGAIAADLAELLIEDHEASA